MILALLRSLCYLSSFRCKHYFCEKCALDAYVKDTKCFACRQQTHGIFNTATDLIGVLKQRVRCTQRQRAAQGVVVVAPRTLNIPTGCLVRVSLLTCTPLSIAT